MRTGRVLERARVASVGLVLLAALVASFADAPSARADASTDFAVVAGSGDTAGATDATSALATDLNEPSSVAVDDAGNVVVVETGRSVVDVVAESSSNPGYPLQSGDVWTPGQVFSIAGGGSTLVSSIGVSAHNAALSSPSSVSFDASGNLLIADMGHSAIDVLALSSSDPGYGIDPWTVGDLYLLAGGGTSTPSSAGTGALATALSRPSDAVTDHSGDVLVADTDHKEVEVLAEAAANPGYVLGPDASWTVGDLYVIAGGGASAPSSTGTAALSTAIQRPDGLAVDAAGNVAIDDSENNVDLLAVGAAAVPAVVDTGTRWSEGNLYVLVGLSDATSPSATGTEAVSTSIDGPVGLVFDAQGNLLVADSLDSEIDVLALTSSGARYVAPAGASWTIGDLYVIAGGGSTTPTSSGTAATETVLDQPTGVAVGPDGALVVADAGSNLVERLESAPSVPGAPSASATTTSVTLSWGAPELDGGSAISGYVIEELSEGGQPLEQITTGSAATSAVVDALSSSTTYGFEIEAVNAIGVSSYSAEGFVATATPDPPAVLSGPSSSAPSSSDAATDPAPGVDPVEVPAARTSSSVAVPAATAQVRLGSHTAAVRATSASIELDCARATCAGSAELVARHEVVEHQGSETETFNETFVLGVRTFRLARGARRTVAIPLDTSARALLFAPPSPVRTATLRIHLRGGTSLVRAVKISARTATMPGSKTVPTSRATADSL